MISGSVHQISRRLARPKIIIKQEEGLIDEHKRGHLRADRH
jgi:hypothetical protein